MTTNNSVNETEDSLVNLIKARYPIIGVASHEEARVIEMLDNASKRAKLDGVVIWSQTDGMKLDDNVIMDLADVLDKIKQYDQEPDKKAKLFILLDAHIYLGAEGRSKDDYIIRKIKDTVNSLMMGNSSLVLVSPVIPVPLELEKLITIVDMPLPSRKEIEMMYRDAVIELEDRVAHDENVVGIADEIKGKMNSLVDAVMGLTCIEADNVLARAVVENTIDADVVIREKAAIIKKSGVLEYHQTNETLESLGGLENLKEHIRKTGKRFSREAEEYGLSKPRGVLLIGLPGCGKSLTAKIIAQELSMPLLRLDMADVSSKYYGETTSNLKMALQVADAISPAILWWDEVEKMFATGSDGGHEETLRALSTLLTHMEESTAPVFRVATANDKSLKPEFMARFEKIFFLDAPHFGERKEIIAIHIRNVGRDPANYNLDAIAERTEGYVGREIRNIVAGAMETAFDEGVEFETIHILNECNSIRPMTEQKKEEINALRKWAEANAVNASKPYKEPEGKNSEKVVRGRRKIQV